MDWIVGGMIFVGTLWLAALVLRQDAEQVNRCRHCGTGLEVTEQAVDLMQLGSASALPAACPDCGASGELYFGAPWQEPWIQ